MPPAPRPGMMNRMWFPNNEENRVQATAATGSPVNIERPTRQKTVRLPNHELDIVQPALFVQKKNTHPQPSNDVAFYQPPASGILSYFPATWVPYAELIRLNEPVWVFCFYYPFLFGTLLAACLLQPSIRPTDLYTANAILFAAAFAARSAACAWSDTMQADYDRQVSRCRLRPVVRGAIAPYKGFIFAALFFAAFIGILTTLPGLHRRQVAFYIVSTLLYPLSKRYTYYAPLHIGLTLASGVMIGSSVQGVDIVALHAAAAASTDHIHNTVSASLCLWLASALWIGIVEVLQDFQGLSDDLQAGITSLAVAHRYDAKPFFVSAAMSLVGCLYMMGALIGAGPLFFAGTCGGAASVLAWMLWRVDLEDGASCARWARWGQWVVGGSIVAVLVGEYASRRWELLGWEWVHWF